MTTNESPPLDVEWELTPESAKSDEPRWYGVLSDVASRDCERTGTELVCGASANYCLPCRARGAIDEYQGTAPVLSVVVDGKRYIPDPGHDPSEGILIEAPTPRAPTFEELVIDTLKVDASGIASRFNYAHKRNAWTDVSAFDVADLADDSSFVAAAVGILHVNRVEGVADEPRTAIFIVMKERASL